MSVKSKKISLKSGLKLDLVFERAVKIDGLVTWPLFTATLVHKTKHAVGIYKFITRVNESATTKKVYLLIVWYKQHASLLPFLQIWRKRSVHF